MLKKLRKLILFLVIPLYYDSSFCMDATENICTNFLAKTKVSHKEGYSKVYSYVDGSFDTLTNKNIDAQNFSFLQNCIKEIGKFSPLLLNKIIEELPEDFFY